MNILNSKIIISFIIIFLVLLKNHMVEVRFFWDL